MISRWISGLTVLMSLAATHFYVRVVVFAAQVSNAHEDFGLRDSTLLKFRICKMNVETYRSAATAKCMKKHAY
jgi:hypothetical protein